MESLSEGVHSNLPKLKNETELQKMLADEKMRLEEHKMNYQNLKVLYSRLQADYANLQQEFRNTIEENQYKYQQLYEDVQYKLKNEDRKKNIDQDNSENNIAGNNDKGNKEQLVASNLEMEMCKEELKRLRFDNSFVKSEYDHLKNEYQSVVRELKLRHEAEIGNLRNERNDTVNRMQLEYESESKQAKQIQKENIQLNIRVKSLLGELDEIRNQRDYKGLQMDNVTRLQTKHFTDFQTNIKSLESEKESLTNQLEAYNKEIHNLRNENHRVTTRCHDLEKINQNLKNRLDELAHKFKLEISELKLSSAKSKTDSEKERMRLQAEVENLRTDLEVYQLEIKRSEDLKVETERNMSKRMQEALEEEWTKQQVIESENMKLELSLETMERIRKQTDMEWETRINKMENELKMAQEATIASEKEVITARSRLINQQTLLDDLQHEKTLNNNLKNKLRQIETSHEDTLQQLRLLKEEHEECAGRMKLLTQDAIQLKLDHGKEMQYLESQLAQERSDWKAIKVEMQSRVDDLEHSLYDVRTQNTNITASYKQKKSQMKSINYKLRDKLYAMKLEFQQLRLIEPNSNETNKDDQSDTKRKLRELVRRNNQFHALLTAVDLKTKDIGGHKFITVSSFNQDLDLNNINDQLNQFNINMNEQLDLFKNQGNLK